MPKIEIEVKNINTNSIWKEKYTINDNNPREWAENLIQNFNDTLRVGEAPRQLINVVVVDELEKRKDHDWEKQNLVTVIRGLRTYDEYKCSKCGITGKRFALSSIITPDSKYKAKKYRICIGGE